MKKQISQSSKVTALSNAVLIETLISLHNSHRHGMAAIIAHLAELDRRRLYIALGYTSTFAYLTSTFNLSKSQACLRICAARLVSQVPNLCDYIAHGKLHLSAIQLLAPLLRACETVGEQQALLESASHKTKKAVQVLVAHLSPKLAVAASIRKLPNCHKTKQIIQPELQSELQSEPQQQNMLQPQSQLSQHQYNQLTQQLPRQSMLGSRGATVEPLNPAAYKVVFTADAACKEYLERAKQLTMLTKHKGKLELIMKAALQDFVEKLEKRKFGMVLSTPATITGNATVAGAEGSPHTEYPLIAR